MSFSRLRTQVDTLMRKYAIELEAYRLRPLAQEFCDEMADSVTVNKDAPKLSLLEWTQVFAKRMISRGFRGQHLLDLHDYLKRCLDRRVLPQANDVLRRLLPKAEERGLIPRSRSPVSF